MRFTTMTMKDMLQLSDLQSVVELDSGSPKTNLAGDHITGIWTWST